MKTAGVFLLVLAAAAAPRQSSAARALPEDLWATEDVIFEIVGGPNGPVLDGDNPDAKDIKGGFEGGTVVKLDGTYFAFPTERAGLPDMPRSYNRIKTRIGCWSSADGLAWRRVRTLYESSGKYTRVAEDNPYSDRRASLWAAMPVYNDSEDRWNLFYVAYTVNPHIGPNHCFGRIWRAVSTAPGRTGITGPYEDAGIVLEPGLESQPWEGRQAVDSFFPFKVGEKWHGFYGGAFAIPGDHVWRVGLAWAPELAGPWHRMGPDVNPVRSIHPWFVENPVVTTLPGGVYAAVFDGGPRSEKLPNMVGYSISVDGLNWSKAGYLPLHTKVRKWWKTMRTPLCLIDEGDNVYTMFFTAWRAEGMFHPIGMVKLRLDAGKLREAACRLRQSLKVPACSDSRSSTSR
jgi:hypothetical protein